MPFSRSRSPESMTRSATSWFSRNEPDCQSIASTRVVLPWSTCATMATFLRSSRWARVFDTARQGSDPVYGVRRPCPPAARSPARAAALRFPPAGTSRRARRGSRRSGARRLRMLLAAVHERHAVVAEHAEVPDEACRGPAGSRLPRPRRRTPRVSRRRRARRPGSNPSSAGTTRTRPARTASTMPTSRIGRFDRRRKSVYGCAGAGRP